MTELLQLISAGGDLGQIALIGLLYQQHTRITRLENKVWG